MNWIEFLIYPFSYKMMWESAEALLSNRGVRNWRVSGEAKFISSSMIHSPFTIALVNTPLNKNQN